MADEVRNRSENGRLKASFVIYVVTVVVFLFLMYDSLVATAGPFGLDLGRADFVANCLRLVADALILAGFWKGRRIKLLMAGFLLNIIPQAFDLLVHYNGLKDNLIQGLAFVATVFLIVFYFMLTNINMSITSRDDTYMFTKISVLICVFFWFVSDIVNLTGHGFEGAFTVIFLLNDLLQMAMLVMWGFLMTDYIKLDKGRT
ncbi:MAG: hypothetical protein J5623_03065 [Clostridiales bacterium]|nr:hypothetical protein [Clostridiales bacterium]